MTPGTYRIALCCAESAGTVDGIRDYTICLRDALRESHGADADVIARTSNGTWVALHPAADRSSTEHRRLGALLSEYDAVVVQYNPFMYGRWGFAPWLPWALWRLSRRDGAPRIAVMVHEPFIHFAGWRWTLMGLWQRAQLLAALGSADAVFVSIEAWSKKLRQLGVRQPLIHLPVGSNIPDGRSKRRGERDRLGVPADTVVVATFGTAIPGRLSSHVAAAVSAIAAAGMDVLLQSLGAGAPVVEAPHERVRVVTTGPLPADAVSARLAAADLFLAPFVDGVSTRRSSLMAALQHGLPVVGTLGFLTDRSFRDAQGLRLVPAADEGAFAAAALELALEPGDRRAVGRSARELYERCFDWGVVSEKLLAHLQGAAESSALAPVPVEAT